MNGQRQKPQGENSSSFYLTVTIFQLNEEGLIIHEVIEIGYDVVVL